MRLRRGKKKRRACVVGLDGVPIGLLKRLAEGSVMPRTAGIIGGGGLRQMRAALPPVSSVSWSSFMTGANPGAHGIFGFTDVNAESYQLEFPMFPDLAAPTLWDRLGERGRRCAVINQPATYPAREMAGALVSGFVALSLERSVWPRGHLRALEGMGYRVDVDARGAQEDPDGLLDQLESTLETHRRAARYFWEQEEWDYFELVVTGTDRLHHFLWRAVEEADDPRHERAMAYYRAVDAVVGEVWDRFHAGGSGDREGEGFLLLSDHGFAGVERDVRLNAWLAESGYLEYAREKPESVGDIGPRTRAFALDPGRIYLNVKGRFARGCVEPEEAPALRAELAARLCELAEGGETVITRVFAREEIYEGARAHLGPDLVALSKPGYDLKGTTKEQCSEEQCSKEQCSKGRKVFGETRFQGMHTWEDAFVWTLLPIPAEPEISDLAGAIIAWVAG